MKGGSQWKRDAGSDTVDSHLIGGRKIGREGSDAATGSHCRNGRNNVILPVPMDAFDSPSDESIKTVEYEIIKNADAITDT